MPKKTGRIPIAAPDNFVTRNAIKFCEENTDWSPLPKGEYNAYVREEMDKRDEHGKVLQCCNIWGPLNQRKQLRPDYQSGVPKRRT